MTQSEIRLFKAKVKLALVMRSWNYAELAKQVGYSYSAVCKLLDGTRQNEALKKKISDCLELEKITVGLGGECSG